MIRRLKRVMTHAKFNAFVGQIFRNRRFGHAPGDNSRNGKGMVIFHQRIDIASVRETDTWNVKGDG